MTSRWAAQLGALGLDPAFSGSADAAKEKAAFEGLTLPELVLPPAPPRIRWKRLGVATGLMVLVLGFVLVQRAADDPLRMKGRAQITVWWERGGDIRPLTDTTTLVEGDRVRAEVQAPVASTAYWLVHDTDAKPLVDAAFVLASALPLEAGKAAAFTQSLKIVGPAVGETLVILVCKQPLDVHQVARALERDTPEPCEPQSFRLRPAATPKER